MMPSSTVCWGLLGRAPAPRSCRRSRTSPLLHQLRVRLDVRYVRTRNLLMDLKIVCQTIMVVLNPRDRGAY